MTPRNNYSRKVRVCLKKALIWRRKGKEALKLLEQEGEDEDEESVVIVNMFGEMGEVIRRQGELADAEKYFAKESARQQRLLVPPGDVSFGHLNLNMGTLRPDQGKYAEALKYYQKALKICLAKLVSKVSVLETHITIWREYIKPKATSI